MKRTAIVLALTLLLCLTYVGCGAAEKTSDTRDYSTAYNTADGAQAGAMEEYASENAGATGTEDSGSVTIPQDNRKIIYNATLELEATDFDATQQALMDACKAAGGYVSSTDVSSYTNESRYATYEFRIPADSYNSFLTALDKAGNVLSQSENTQDITADYVDVEARLNSLKLQEERLLQMMEEAGDLDTLLAIQNQLTEVQYRIESYTSQKRTYDDLVSYSTVTVNVSEVAHVTERRDTFGSRIGSAFRESWRGFGEGCQNFAVWFVGAIPTLLVLGALAAAAIFCIGRIRRIHATKRAANPRPAPVPYRYNAPVAAQQRETPPQNGPEERK